jgi:tRNA threonylcarbamoyladenosine biosynthesis protein TsaE
MDCGVQNISGTCGPKTFECDSLEDTCRVAEFFAKLATKGSCFVLYGNLGYGKTTFAKYFIKAIDPKICEISSPTFTIVNTYDCNFSVDSANDAVSTIRILHIDCYRINKKEEFFELGLEELFMDSISIIEWPEIIQDFLPKDTIKISFLLGEKEKRIIHCENVPQLQVLI